MSRLTKKCGDWGYTVPGLNSVVKDNAEIIGLMINKLAEYENLDLTPYELEKMRADAVCLYKENQQLKQRVIELEGFEPKFKINEKVFVIIGKVIHTKSKIKAYINNDVYYVKNGSNYHTVKIENIFRTKEEALQKLKEMKGEN